MSRFGRRWDWNVERDGHLTEGEAILILFGFILVILALTVGFELALKLLTS